MSSADYIVHKIDDAYQVVYIIDLDEGSMSVTNDAERVVYEVNEDFPGYRIIYRDSMNIWSELLHREGKFRGFGPSHEAPT